MVSVRVRVKGGPVILVGYYFSSVSLCDELV